MPAAGWGSGSNKSSSRVVVVECGCLRDVVVVDWATGGGGEEALSESRTGATRRRVREGVVAGRLVGRVAPNPFRCDG